jgi:hypothetical protein
LYTCINLVREIPYLIVDIPDVMADLPRHMTEALGGIAGVHRLTYRAKRAGAAKRATVPTALPT